LWLLMLSARRPAEFSGSRLGLLSGWTERIRASRAEEPGPVSTLLSLGICDLEGVLRGEDFNFIELLDQVSGPAQIVYTNDDALVRTAGVIAGQLKRTDADREAIARDLAQTLPSGPLLPEPRDWIFAGAFLDALKQCPIDDSYRVLSRDGLQSTGPADVVLMSISAETHAVRRHRRLGYVAHMHRFRLGKTGPAFQHWVQANFEPVRTTVETIRADYEAVIDRIRARRPGTHIVVCNGMSSSAADDIQCYSAFDEPIGETVESVRGKELNLMLTDLEREKGIAVIDVDAIAAEVGARRHLPDGVHQSGTMQVEVRAELLRTLRARGVAGFGPSRLN
jgi:hypothetical protein